MSPPFSTRKVKEFDTLRKIKKLCGRSALLALAFLFFWQVAALAAQLTAVRFGSGVERERIVFEMSAIPPYEAKTSADGKQVVIEFTGLSDGVRVKPATRGEVIRRVSYQKAGKNLRVVIDLAEPADYEIKTLHKPERIYINFQKYYERRIEEVKAPGLRLTKYLRRDGRGLLTAYLLDVDPLRYNLVPALANGEVQGRATVSDIAADLGAMAAINASYFDATGAILGVLRMDGALAGTTYFTRSALGIRQSGTAFVAPVHYNASVQIGRVSRYVSGVNIDRGEDALILYNRLFAATTGTNEYGRELIVRGGKVTAIRKANSPIPADGYVLSLHGAAKDAFARVKVGDAVTLTEDFGARWLRVPNIIGAGPTLVKGGRVAVNAKEEQFPSDIAVGRAPRTGVAILSNRHILLAVVDGRQASSIGCTLEEFAELLVQFGAKEAVNFDGGGSSEMVVGDVIVSSPSDGDERPVGSALAVLRK